MTHLALPGSDLRHAPMVSVSPPRPGGAPFSRRLVSRRRAARLLPPPPLGDRTHHPGGSAWPRFSHCLGIASAGAQFHFTPRRRPMSANLSPTPEKPECPRCGSFDVVLGAAWSRSQIGRCGSPESSQWDCEECGCRSPWGERRPETAYDTWHAPFRQMKRWKRALEGCTPGGSEFVNEPEICAAFVKDARHRLFTQVKTRIKEVKQLREEVKQLQGKG